MNILTLSAKNCMSHLLLKDTFDHFSFIEGEITTFNTFTIDGFLKKDFFDEAPEDVHSHWKDVREFCFQIIRGKRTPISFKIILSLAPENFADFLLKYEVSGFRPEDIQGMYLNLNYDGTRLTCTTGISLKLFTMDKTLEKAWDDAAQKKLLELELVI